ncbi:MAG: histidinol-phosphate transaminase [Eggerthellaceae bacterium]|nr:histidinol-phosphate transaminase [Eggerthellaceae bacterium]
MNQVRPPAPQLADIEPYDPKYIPAKIMVSANENSSDVPFDIRREIERETRKVAFNRYPDPLANDLRDLIAEANGLDRDQVIMGNGGDELLFNIALAWGGPGRKFLNMPPTFSVYKNNAQLTNTEIVNVDRLADFSIDEDAVVARLAQGDIDFTIVTTPNNPSGNIASNDFVARACEASDALVMVDEAYFEFSRYTARPLLARYENLVILRTFSKAFSLAGVRLGYLLGSERVLTEFKKVRQPYSVDAVSQAIGRVVFANRAKFEKEIDQIIEERGRMHDALCALDGVEAFPSESNYILFRLADADAGQVWQRLLDRGILVRDFSRSAGLEGCLRVSIGLPEENACFLAELKAILEGAS